MRDWQAIETAPRDRDVILLSGDGWMLIGCWEHHWEFNAVKFTHWMPLPDPPKVIAVERIPVSDDQSQAIPEALHQGKNMT